MRKECSNCANYIWSEDINKLPPVCCDCVMVKEGAKEIPSNWKPNRPTGEMKTIIATIKPRHLDNIRAGIKWYEMRTTCPKEVPFKVLCCQSGSGGQIIAEFVVNSPMWAYVSNKVLGLLHGACVSEKEAEEYAAGRRIWFWDINNMVDYLRPSAYVKGYRVRNISEFGLKRPPQSWCYVKEIDNA